MLERHEAIDAAAVAAGRDPAAIRRVVNVGADASAERLIEIARDLRFDTLIVSVDETDPVGSVRRLGEEIAPRVRDALA